MNFAFLPKYLVSFIQVKPENSNYYSVYELATHAKIKIKPKYGANTVHLHFPSKQKVFPG